MDFGEILTKAWKIIWKHKVLWIFGLLAGCGAQGGGGSGGGSNFSSSGGNGFRAEEFPFRNAPPWIENFFYQMQQAVESGTIWIYIALIVLALIVISLIFGAIFLVLRTIGQVGLVRGAWQADEGVAKIQLSQLLSEVWHYFWRVILLSIVLTILGWIVGIILILPIIAVSIFTLGCGLICLIPILIIFSVGISVFVELTLVAVVGEDLDLMKGVERAWEIVTNNLGPVIVIALILYVGQFVIGVILVLPIFLLIAPVLVGIFAESTAVTITSIIISLIGLMIFILFSIVINSIIKAYVGTAWTLVFRRLTGRGLIEEAELSPDLPEGNDI